jgi:hypothetical protein
MDTSLLAMSDNTIPYIVCGIFYALEITYLYYIAKRDDDEWKAQQEINARLDRMGAKKDSKKEEYLL